MIRPYSLSLRHILAAIACLAFASSTANAQPSIFWAEPSVGNYNSSSNWSEPSVNLVGGTAAVPTQDDSAYFGANAETTSGNVTVQFGQNQSVIRTGIISGSFEFQFAGPNLTYSTIDLDVGANRGFTNIFPSDLPSTATLLIDSTVQPGTIESNRIAVGSSHDPDSTFPIASGLLIVSGEGNRLESNVDSASPNAFAHGRFDIGALDNSGQLEIRDGATAYAEEIVRVGSGISRGVSEGQTLTGDGRVIVSGRGTTNIPATLTADFGIFVGTSDDIREGGRISRSLGLLTVESGGQVVTDRIGVGDQGDGDQVISNAELGLPPDRIIVRREIGSTFNSVSKIAARQLTLGIDAVFDLGLGGGGGIATLGEVSDALITDFETLYIGNGGSLAGGGNILGDVQLLSGGLIDPGFLPVGMITIDGSLTAEAGEIRFEITGPNAMTDFDRLVVLGNAQISSSITIEFVDYAPTEDGQFELFAIDGTSSFAAANVQISGLPTGVATFAGGTVFVSPNSGSNTGNFDADGDVDGDDVDFYIGNLDQPATGALAQLDLNGDGNVTIADHDLHVTTLVVTSNGVTGALLGDVDLDGAVNVLSDAFPLVGSLGQSVTSRSQGDLNADGVVNVLRDAFILISDLGQSNEP